MRHEVSTAMVTGQHDANAYMASKVGQASSYDVLVPSGSSLMCKRDSRSASWAGNSQASSSCDFFNPLCDLDAYTNRVSGLGSGVCASQGNAVQHWGNSEASHERPNACGSMFAQASDYPTSCSAQHAHPGHPNASGTSTVSPPSAGWPGSACQPAPAASQSCLSNSTMMTSAGQFCPDLFEAMPDYASQQAEAGESGSPLGPGPGSHGAPVDSAVGSFAESFHSCAPGHVQSAEEVWDWKVPPEMQQTILQMMLDEEESAVVPNYMDFHGQDVMAEGLWITPTMRLMTVNWISEAVYDLGLNQNVVAMAVTLLDRYLSTARQFPRTMLQLAGAASIFVASKIEGMLPHPRGSDITALADGAFDLGHLVRFERTLCQTLHFNLYGPTTQNFLDMWEQALPPPANRAEAYFVDKVHVLASFILELSALVYASLRRKRSVLAAAALLLAHTDAGLHAAVAETLHTDVGTIQAHAEHLVRHMRQYLGPALDGPELTVVSAELLHLHRLAREEENGDQFVVVKFSGACYDSISTVARPVSSDSFRQYMHLFFGGGSS